jgi:hypothetical protein
VRWHRPSKASEQSSLVYKTKHGPDHTYLLQHPLLYELYAHGRYHAPGYKASQYSFERGLLS